MVRVVAANLTDLVVAVHTHRNFRTPLVVVDVKVAFGNLTAGSAHACACAPRRTCTTFVQRNGCFLNRNLSVRKVAFFNQPRNKCFLIPTSVFNVLVRYVCRNGRFVYFFFGVQIGRVVFVGLLKLFPAVLTLIVFSAVIGVFLQAVQEGLLEALACTQLLDDRVCGFFANHGHVVAVVFADLYKFQTAVAARNDAVLGRSFEHQRCLNRCVVFVVPHQIV